MDELDLEPIDLGPPSDPTPHGHPIARRRRLLGVLAATVACGLLFAFYPAAHHRNVAIPTRISPTRIPPHSATTLVAGPIDPQLALEVRVLLFAGREEKGFCN